MRTRSDVRSKVASDVQALLALSVTKRSEPTPEEDNDDQGNNPEVVKMFVPILKADEEKREVTGVVLQPEVTDAQGDIMDDDVIEKAAGDFLAGYGTNTKLGYMHKQFNKRFELRQSFIAPSGLVINNKTVNKGAWVMVVRVIDNDVWKSVKDGKITGFSIGGKAKVKQLDEE